MGMNELLAETLTLGEKSGIGQQTVYDLVKGKFWNAFYSISTELMMIVSEIMPAPGYVCCRLHYFGWLKLMRVNSLVAYGHKMVNDLFDGSIGFALDGGIKDAKLVPRGARNRYFFLT